MSHDKYSEDHDHDECLRLPCPRCGCDPVTGRYVPDDFSVKRWSCEMCQPCWTTYEADMEPHERELHLIEEHFP